MTVAELIQTLKRAPLDAIVLLSNTPYGAERVTIDSSARKGEQTVCIS